MEKKSESKKYNSTTKIVKKSKVHYVKLAPKPEIKTQKVNKKQQKKKKEQIKKEIVKKSEKPKEIKKIVQKSKNKVKKTTPKEEIKKEVKQAQKEQKKQIEQKSALSEFLSTPTIQRQMPVRQNDTQTYIELYGEEYNNFDKEEKKFLEDNLRAFVVITQRYLNRSYIPINLEEEQKNDVVFTMYPNGDISKPLITNSSDYSALDGNTIETIELAYKEYPTFKKPIKIRFRVRYLPFGY